MIDKSDYKTNCITKEELKEIAKEVHELLRTKELPIWQYEEVLRYTHDVLEHVIIR